MLRSQLNLNLCFQAVNALDKKASLDQFQTLAKRSEPVINFHTSYADKIKR